MANTVCNPYVVTPISASAEGILVGIRKELESSAAYNPQVFHQNLAGAVWRAAGNPSACHARREVFDLLLAASGAETIHAWGEGTTVQDALELLDRATAINTSRRLAQPSKATT